jgi:nitrate/nitrite-specific signal transduction histidine kinase
VPVGPLRGAGRPETRATLVGWLLRLPAARQRLRQKSRYDGVGFDPSRPVAAGHHGLGNMRTRAEAIGATLRVKSAKGEGARIIVALPSREILEAT